MACANVPSALSGYVCCSVLQCVAVCCSVLQWVLEYCIGSSVVYYVAVNVTKAVCRCPKCFLEVRVLQ